MALKQYFNIVLVPLKFIPKRTASFWQTIKIPNRFVLKICTGGFADYKKTNEYPDDFFIWSIASFTVILLAFNVIS